MRARGSTAVAALFVFAIAGCGAPASTPTASRAPSQTVSPSSSTADAWWIEADGHCGEASTTYGCAGPLTAGSHASEALRPGVTYTVPSGWVNVADWPDFYMLIPDTPANRAAVAADDVAQSVLVLTGGHNSTATAGCNEETPQDPVAITAVDLANALEGREGLETSEASQVTLSGLHGVQIDVSLRDGWTATCPDDATTPAEHLWPGELVYDGDRHRLIVLDTADGSTLTIRLFSSRTDFESFVAVAMPVVESFEFNLSR